MSGVARAHRAAPLVALLLVAARVQVQPLVLPAFDQRRTFDHQTARLTTRPHRQRHNSAPAAARAPAARGGARLDLGGGRREVRGAEEAPPCPAWEDVEQQQARRALRAPRARAQARGLRCEHRTGPPREAVDGPAAGSSAGARWEGRTCGLMTSKRKSSAPSQRGSADACTGLSQGWERSARAHAAAGGEARLHARDRGASCAEQGGRRGGWGARLPSHFCPSNTSTGTTVGRSSSAPAPAPPPPPPPNGRRVQRRAGAGSGGVAAPAGAARARRSLMCSSPLTNPTPGALPAWPSGGGTADELVPLPGETGGGPACG